MEQWVEARWLEGWGAQQETRSVRQADDNDEAIAVMEEQADRLRAEFASADRVRRPALLAELEALELQRDAVASRPLTDTSLIKASGRTLAEAWSAGSPEERHELLARTVGSLRLRKLTTKRDMPFMERRLVDAQERLWPE